MPYQARNMELWLRGHSAVAMVAWETAFFFCFDFLPNWVLSRQKISDAEYACACIWHLGIVACMGVPKQRTAGVFHHFSTIFARKKGGVFSRFQAGFCWALSDFARISGPIFSGFDGFFSAPGMAQWHTSRASSFQMGWSTEECNKMDQCRNCLSGHGCWSIDTWTGYGVSSYGDWTGQDRFPEFFQ